MCPGHSEHLQQAMLSVNCSPTEFHGDQDVTVCQLCVQGPEVLTEGPAIITLQSDAQFPCGLLLWRVSRKERSPSTSFRWWSGLVPQYLILGLEFSHSPSWLQASLITNCHSMKPPEVSPEVKAQWRLLCPITACVCHGIWMFPAWEDFSLCNVHTIPLPPAHTYQEAPQKFLLTYIIGIFPVN